MKRTAPSRLEDQVAERQPPHLRRGVGGGEHGEDAAADVGADHQAERHRHRDHAGGGEGGDQQHHGQAGVGQHRQHRADDDVEQDLVRQGDEQRPDLGRFGQRPGGGDDQLQRQGDQPEADQHPAERADAAVLARDEDHHADEDQERREPRQVEREHHRHDAGADVGAEHHRQGGAGGDQVLADEGGDDQAGGGARLHQAGDAEPGDQGAEAVAEAERQDPAQVLPEHPQHAGADDVRAPDEQGDRGEEIEKVDQVGGVVPVSSVGGQSTVEHQVEGVEVAPAPLGIDVLQAPVDDQRHPLLGDAAVRAQRHLERGEVVARDRGADHLRALGDDHQVADPVGRQLEEGGGRLARAHALDAAQRGDARRQRRRIDVVRQVDGGERAERAVVDDVGVGDRQDHPGAAGAEPGVEQVLEVEHVGGAVHAGLGVHAVVGGEGDDAAEGVELAEVAVHHPVEGVGALGAGRVLVLHVVGGREVHHVGPALVRHQLDAGGEHELRQGGAVDRGHRHADPLDHLVDAVLVLGRLVGLLGREADALHAVAEELPQLVLGGDRRPGTGRRWRGRPGWSARAATSGRSSSPRCPRRRRTGSCRRCRAPTAARR